MELSIPMVIALNMMDEVTASGNSIDVKKLSSHLGIPVVPISASRGEGINELIDVVIRSIKDNSCPKKLDFCVGEVHKAIHSISHLIYDQAEAVGYPPRFAATKLVEGDEPTFKSLAITDNQIHIIEHVVKDMEEALKTDREAALADMRYCYIEKICLETVVKRQETVEQQRSEKIDEILTHKYFGIPIFLGIMFFIFWMTFNVIGAPLQELLETLIDALTETTSNALIAIGVSDWLHSLVIDGIFAGVGSVLSFLPIIVVLFFFLSFLEDSGYMARVAFLMDKLLRKIGLSGRSFVPMLIGFGCSVPAIMATRTLASERDRKMTIVLTPFMSCSAKLPIYGMITAAFFPDNAALVMIGLYVMGIAVAILSGLLLKNTIFKGEPVPFVMELPAYRIPTRKSILNNMWDKGKDFIQRAFTVIFLGTIIIWFLQNFNWSLNMVEDSSNSILAYLGSIIAPIFLPLGFKDWRASTALITGLTAKEAVVSTLSVLTGTVTDIELSQVLFTIFTPLSAFAFLTFTLLYMPCIAAFAATKRELGSIKYAVLTALYQTATAYVTGTLVFQIGSILIGG
jgi:ferrous iron transport protein B